MSHYQNIIDYLEKHQVSFKTIHHEETRTSEESARVRGVDLKTGGKALVLKIRDGDDNNDNNNDDNNTFAIFVLSASRKLHTKAIKKEFRSKNVRFATRDELTLLTNGLLPGSVPPFGKPLINNSLNLYVDTSITEQDIIAFNCGSLTDSVIMSVSDYLKISYPTKVFLFSKE